MKRKLSMIHFVLMAVLLLAACSGGAAAGSGDMPAPPDGARPDAPQGSAQGNPPEGAPKAAEGAFVTEEPASAPAEATATAEATPTPQATATQQASLEPTATQETELRISAVLEIGTKTFNKTHEDIDAAEDNQSAALVTNGGTLTIGYAAITTSGDSSSTDNSSLFGQNAAALGNEESTLKVLYSSVKTSGKGATGVYARGELTNATVLDSSIETGGDYAHAVMAAIGASMDVTNAELTTSGDHASAITTDHGYAAIDVADSSAVTNGSDSPAIAAGSGGVITVENSTLSANASAAAAIAGSGSIEISDSDLTTSADEQAVVAFLSGEGEDLEGGFSMEGGSLTHTGGSGALFSASNASGVVEMENVNLNVKSGLLARAEAGELTFTAEGVALNGDISADESSLVEISLEDGSTLTGAINPDNSADVIRLTLDASSSWNVTADSYLTKLNDEAGISGTTISNISGNGFTVYYNANSNIYLKGKIYTLNGGGYLKPLN